MVKKVRRRRPSPPKTWFIWLMLFLFFPIGLYLLWKHKPYEQLPRIIITVFVTFLLFTSIFTAILYKQSLDKKAEKAENAETAPAQQETALEVSTSQYTPQQLAFLQFSKDLNQEIKIYTAISTEYKSLTSNFQKNHIPAPGIAAASIDTYNRRLEQSRERILEMTPPANLNTADQERLAKNLADYAAFLKDLKAAFILKQASLVRDDIEAGNLSDQNLEKAENNFQLIHTDLTTIAQTLNVPFDMRIKFKNTAQIPSIPEPVKSNTEPVQTPPITEQQKTTATMQALPQGSVDGAPEIKGDIVTIYD